MQEDYKGLPVPLSQIDDVEHREQLAALVRLRCDDQHAALRLLIGLAVFVLAWLWFWESGKQNVGLTIERPTRELQYLIDLNNAPKNELLQLPGIGTTLADRIIEYREDVALFERASDLQKIHGIGVKKCDDATPYVYVSDNEM